MPSTTNAGNAPSLSAQRREKKRRHDREAQRASRERTKQQVAHLENLVRTLQAANDRPEQLSGLLSQVDKGREEIRRLKDTLSRIHHLTIPENYQTRTEIAKDVDGGEDPSPSPLDVFDHGTIQPDDTFLDEVVGHDMTEDLSMFDSEIFGSPSVFPTLGVSTSVTESREHQVLTKEVDPLPKGFIPPTSLSKPLDTATSSENDPVVTIASKILTAPRSEGHWLVLAGSVLNFCLNTTDELLTPRVLDDDIAIRACVEGWKTVKQMYWLDAGWRWLRQLDENMYFHLSWPQRMAIMRVQRMQYLVQRGKSSVVDLPSFMTPRPAQQQLNCDKLDEHWVWPGFRERVLFTRKYISDKFVRAFCTNLRFAWPRDPWETYERNTNTELYTFMPLFLQHQARLDCWQMDPDFFHAFPELAADMPSTRPSLLGSGIRGNPVEYGVVEVEETDDQFLLQSQHIDLVASTHTPLIC